MEKLLKTNLPDNVFKEIVDNSEDGYMIMDNKGNILYVNKAYLRVSDKKFMIGENVKAYLSKGELNESVALMALNEKRQVQKSSIIRKGVPLSIKAIPVFNELGDVEKVITITKDISVLTQLKNNLEDLQILVKNYEMPLKGTNEYGDNIIAVSSASKNVFDTVDKIKNFSSNVIITGESGVGKDVVARYIHNTSIRKDKPFIAINCSAMSEQIMETELFGYVSGTFTGGNKSGKKGLFEAANGGTLFLDEVGDMPLNLQVKLLRTIENRTIIRVGDHKEIPIDVRIISATNKNLKEMVKEKSFREDLYYRLYVINIYVPSLRERKEDIVTLSMFFLKKFNSQYKLTRTLSNEILYKLEQYSWPGNIRELKNVIERIVIFNNSKIEQELHLPFLDEGENSHNKIITNDKDVDFEEAIVVKKIIKHSDAIKSLESQLFTKAKKEYKNCRSIGKALGIDYSTVSRKLRKYGLIENN